MMNRRFLVLTFLGIFQLGSLLNPALAAWYRTDMSNCSITDIGNHQWKVDFDIKTITAGEPPTAVFNYLQIKIPTISGTGMNRSNFVWNPVPIEELTLPSGIVARGVPSAYTPAITLAQPTGSLIIRPNGGETEHVSFIITPTAENNAYPAALIYAYASNSSNLYREGYYWFIPNHTKGTCIASGAAPSVTPPPITELMPVDPEFTMNSAEWILPSTDLGDLPDVAAAGTGYPVSINNVSNNNLCVRYVTAGVTSKQYALAVTNSTSTQGGRNLFMLRGPNSSQLFYNLQLSSNDSTAANNFNFPAIGTQNYISLKQTNNYSADRSEMCWTPKINLFKSSSTKEGLHSDTLNFIITPKA